MRKEGRRLAVCSHTRAPKARKEVIRNLNDMDGAMITHIVTQSACNSGNKLFKDELAVSYVDK